jgi:hypothetical protein
MKNFAGFRPKQCEHCGKQVDSRHYALWHGDNCKTLRPPEPEPEPLVFGSVHDELLHEVLVYISLHLKSQKYMSLPSAQALRTSLRKIRSLAHTRTEEIHNSRPPKEGKYRISDKITCEHCGTQANLQNYKKWHGDNCRNK